MEAATILGGLDEMSLGPAPAGLLASIDVEQLSGRDAVIFARAQQRQFSHDQARQYRALSRIADFDAEEGPEAQEFASAEVGAALRQPQRDPS